MVGHSFDAAFNLRVAFQRVGHKNAERILRAFQRYAIPAVRIHHRCRNVHARRFVDGAARVDDKRIVRIYQLEIIIHLRRSWPRSNIAVDEHIAAAVFHRNIFSDGNARNLAVGGSLTTGNRQFVRAVHNRHVALNALGRVGALDDNCVERVARALQIHVFGTDNSNLWRLNARRSSVSLGNASACRSQRDILARRKRRIRRLRQVAAICDRDIPCHAPVDGDGQRVGVVHNADVSGNGRFLPLHFCSGFGVFHNNYDAVHDYVIELVVLVFQNQRFAVDGLDGIGGDGALVGLGDAAVLRFQRYRLIVRGHRAVQRQILLGGKRRVASGGDAACHRFLDNRSGTVLFFFPSHGKRAVAFCHELIFRIDGSENQRTVLDIGVVHAFDMSGIRRRDIHHSAVVQDADGIVRITHNAGIDNAGIGVRVELQCLSGVDVGLCDSRVGIAHQEALVAGEGNRVAREHGAQAEIRIVLYVFDIYALNIILVAGAGVSQFPGEGNRQGLIRRANAPLDAAPKKEIFPRDIRRIEVICRVINSLCGV